MRIIVCLSILFCFFNSIEIENKLTFQSLFLFQSDSIYALKCSGKDIVKAEGYFFRPDVKDCTKKETNSIIIGRGRNNEVYSTYSFFTSENNDDTIYYQEIEYKCHIEKEKQIFVIFNQDSSFRWSNDFFFPKNTSNISLRNKAYNPFLNDTIYKFYITPTDLGVIRPHQGVLPTEIGLSKKYGFVYLVEGGRNYNHFEDKTDYLNACITYYQPVEKIVFEH